ncbi:MAG: hypothetical protein V1870_01830 [Candidatus Aenigmatarchaeota archaeon]
MAEKQKETKEVKQKEVKHTAGDDRRKWWNNDLKFSLLFFALGVIMGFVGYVINVPMRSGLLALAVFLGLAFAINKMQKLEENKGWWVSKFVIYIFFWFLVWTVFHTSCSIYNSFCL